jgi:hypothetical protein
VFTPVSVLRNKTFQTRTPLNKEFQCETITKSFKETIALNTFGAHCTGGGGVHQNLLGQCSIIAGLRVLETEENTRLFSPFFFRHSILSSRPNLLFLFSGIVVAMEMPKE